MRDERFICRPLSFDDAEQFARVATAISRCDGTGDQHREDDITRGWREPRFELSKSSLGLFTPQGTLAASAILFATADVPVHPWLRWGVNPDFHEAGLSPRLFKWAEDQMPEVIERCPAQARVSIRAGAVEGYAYAEDALREAGYVAIRDFYDMRIDMTERPDPPGLPAGFILKPYQHETDLPLMVHLVRDSFEDHFGHIEQPFEQELEEFRHWLDNDRTFDPELVHLAYDTATGEIAGCVMGMTEEPHNPELGYIDIVGVRRQYRKRGLASALLRRSFAQFWDRGKRSVNLGVDADSLTNAVALYERVGMRVYRKLLLYDKLIRDGVELERGGVELERGGVEGALA